MVLTLEKFAEYFDFKDARVTYLRLVGNSLHLDCEIVSMDNDGVTNEFKGLSFHFVFRNLKSLSDDYFSSLNKIISRFRNPYIASKATFDDGIFKIDDALAIQCDEVEIEEIL